MPHSCWATFATFLTYKAVWIGKEVRKIARWYPSSKTFSGCGFKREYFRQRGKTTTD
ncbi:MAG: transposase [Thermotogaceae bacterium]|nr:transposase [Thermotogaceae bacterium]